MARDPFGKLGSSEPSADFERGKECGGLRWSNAGSSERWRHGAHEAGEALVAKDLSREVEGGGVGATGAEQDGDELRVRETGGAVVQTALARALVGSKVADQHGGLPRVASWFEISAIWSAAWTARWVALSMVSADVVVLGSGEDLGRSAAT